MPDINDLNRGIKVGLTEEDYNDYKNGNLSNDYYARRKDGSIAHRVDISTLNDDNDDDDMDETPSNGIDVGSAVLGAGALTIIGGVVYGIKKLKKLWDNHKAKKIGIKTSIEPACTTLSMEIAKTNDDKLKALTQDEAIKELMTIIAGMAEIEDGKKKISDGVEKLSNARIVDREALLEKLSDPKMLECLNTYLNSNPQVVMQNQTILSGIFGRSLTEDGQYIPLDVSDIKRQLRNETIRED